MEWRKDKAIYLQIVEMFKKNILNGKYPPKSQIMPIREMAFNLAVNPNTVAKAYDILEEEGLIVVQSTNGFFVTDNKELLTKLKPELAKEYCDAFVKAMSDLGYELDDAIKVLKESI